MIYCILLILSLFFTIQYSCEWAYLQKRSITIYMLFFGLLVLPWILVCGGQYETGTDYKTYITLFRTGDVDLYFNKGEFFFAYIVDFWHGWKLPPQGLYFVFYTICFFFLGLICHKINNRYLYLFLILYFTVSSVFFNQLNLLRQSIAVYIVTYGALNYLTNRNIILLLLLIIVASLFHASSWVILIVPFVAMLKLSSTSLRIISVVVLLLLICGHPIISIVLDALMHYIPPIYRGYLTSSFNSDVSFVRLIPKLVFFPLYFCSLQLLDKNPSAYQKSLFIVGFIAYLFRLISLTNVILDRLGYIFILLSVFPLFLYWEYLSRMNKKFILVSNVLICISVFLIKTLFFASNEYVYHSIYWRMIAV